MAKIKLTKNELKAQKDNLKRFTRYLPTLELKKQQLLQEIRRIQREADQLREQYDKVIRDVSRWVAVFAEDVGLHEFIAVERIDLGKDNVAGIDIPTFEDIRFAEIRVWMCVKTRYGSGQNGILRKNSRTSSRKNCA